MHTNLRQHTSSESISLTCKAHVQIELRNLIHGKNLERSMNHIHPTSELSDCCNDANFSHYPRRQATEGSEQPAPLHTNQVGLIRDGAKIEHNPDTRISSNVPKQIPHSSEKIVLIVIIPVRQCSPRWQRER